MTKYGVHSKNRVEPSIRIEDCGILLGTSSVKFFCLFFFYDFLTGE